MNTLRPFAQRFAYASTFLVCLVTGFLTPTRAVSEEPLLPGYTNYEELRQTLDDLAEEGLVKVESLAKTTRGRSVDVVRIGTGDLDQKPALLIVGGLQPSHLQGSELALRLIRKLAEPGEQAEAVKKVLEKITIYVIPRPTPDACEAFFRKPFQERDTNDRPFDDDHDGQVDEDGPDDLDNNGYMTQMRVEDPEGTWMPHPDDPRVLIEADPQKNERGRYKLYTEGRDNDQDEVFNEDPPGGVAFSRNFTFRYPSFGKTAGPNAVSEPETRAVADFAFGRPNIAGVLSFTPEENLFHPWKANANAEGQRIKTTVQGADVPYLQFLSDGFKKLEWTGEAPEVAAGPGSFQEWAYFHYGRWSLASRGWWVPQVKEEPKEGQKSSGEKRGSESLNALRYLAQQKLDGFVDWHPFEHPDFPGKKVEIGGFKPFVLLNPPERELDAIADKHLKFVLKWADLWPQLKLDVTKNEPLGGGLTRLTVVVRNDGYLPTMPKMGQINSEPSPLQLEVKLPADTQLVTGAPRSKLPVLAGQGGHEERIFLVRGPRNQALTVTLRAGSPAVGFVEQTVALKPSP